MNFKKGGTVRGEGKVIRKDGTVIPFTLTSEPLTEDQAAALNKQQNQEAEHHGSNASNKRA